MFRKVTSPETVPDLAPQKDRSATLPPNTISKSTSPPVAAHEDGVVIIGKGTRIGGTIGDCRVLDVHGVIEADVTAETLIIRDGGGVLGTIQVDRAEIFGVVEGSLTVYNHLEIAATGNVSGQVSFQTLAVATGARLAGDIVTTEPIDHREGLSHIPFTIPAADNEMIGQENSPINGATAKMHAGESVVTDWATQQ